MTRKSFMDRSSRRRGATIITVAVTIMMMLGFAALTLDVGLMFNTKAELQRTSDAAVLAGTQSLASQDRLRSGDAQNAVIADARAKTASYAARNEVLNGAPEVNDADVLIGYLRNPYDPNESMDFSDPSRFNAVRAMVRRDDQANGPIDLIFASVFGRQTATMTTEATAALMDGIAGWVVTEQSGNAGLLPFALKDTSWINLLNETVTTGDLYSYNPSTGLVTDGADGIHELNLYPGATPVLPPGNFGTVDIGEPNNSGATLARQILDGVSAEDLAYHGGELRFGPDGTLELDGDTGITAGIKEELEAIKGLPRAIPIFITVSGNGDNATYTIIAWAGVRVMNVKFQGSPKRVIIQPATLVDDATVVEVASGQSYGVFQPVRLVR